MTMPLHKQVSTLASPVHRKQINHFGHRVTYEQTQQAFETALPPVCIRWALTTENPFLIFFSVLDFVTMLYLFQSH